MTELAKYYKKAYARRPGRPMDPDRFQMRDLKRRVKRLEDRIDRLLEKSSRDYATFRNLLEGYQEVAKYKVVKI